jgi:uncharacterized protein (TIGR00290 family)
MIYQIPKAGESFVCAWNGGRDACLALYHAIRAGAKPQFLLTMLDETGKYSYSLPIPREVLQAQALSLNIPLLTKTTNKANYNQDMLDVLHELKAMDINIVIFGDILLDNHRRGNENLCQQAGLQTYLPLWGTPKSRILAEYITSGFIAMITTASDKLGQKYAGRYLDTQCIEELEALQGIDPIGENGEYHTVIIDGPIFANPIPIRASNIKTMNNNWVTDLNLLSINY